MGLRVLDQADGSRRPSVSREECPTARQDPGGRHRLGEASSTLASLMRLQCLLAVALGSPSVSMRPAAGGAALRGVREVQRWVGRPGPGGSVWPYVAVLGDGWRWVAVGSGGRALRPLILGSVFHVKHVGDEAQSRGAALVVRVNAVPNPATLWFALLRQCMKTSQDGRKPRPSGLRGLRGPGGLRELMMPG